MTTIGKISRMEVRRVWKHEAHDFTKWLEQNIDVLPDIIGIQICNVEREHSVGSFSVDLYAEDASGNPIVIENQLDKSDHDHLGKVMTYLSFVDAKVAIWITPDPRPEHAKVLEWLNTNQRECSFYLLKLEAVKIGDSAPAPLLTPVVEPSETIRSIGQERMVKSRRHELRYKFWQIVLEETKKVTSLFNSISPTQYNWIGAGSGKGGVGFIYMVTMDNLTIKLYIDRENSNEINLKIFQSLYENKDEIEKKFGAKLVWNENPENRACNICTEPISGGWNTDESQWHQIAKSGADVMKKFEAAFKPFIAKIKF